VMIRLPSCSGPAVVPFWGSLDVLVGGRWFRFGFVLPCLSLAELWFLKNFFQNLLTAPADSVSADFVRLVSVFLVGVVGSPSSRFRLPFAAAF